MSIYRGWKAYHAYKPEVREPEPTRNDGPPPVHLRKAQPILKLLPRTAAWLASLPNDMRPRVLAEQYARIANNFAAVWHSPAECRAYFDDLLIDRRGGRKGFPVTVLREIQRLQRLHQTLYPPRNDNVWRV